MTGLPDFLVSVVHGPDGDAQFTYDEGIDRLHKLLSDNGLSDTVNLGVNAKQKYSHWRLELVPMKVMFGMPRTMSMLAFVEVGRELEERDAALRINTRRKTITGPLSV